MCKTAESEELRGRDRRGAVFRDIHSSQRVAVTCKPHVFLPDKLAAIKPVQALQRVLAIGLVRAS